MINIETVKGIVSCVVDVQRDYKMKNNVNLSSVVAKYESSNELDLIYDYGNLAIKYNKSINEFEFLVKSPNFKINGDVHKVMLILHSLNRSLNLIAKRPF